MIRSLPNSKPLIRRRLLLLRVYIFLSLHPGIVSSGVVILKSIEIFNTHELLSLTPTVYFRCHGENKTYLPDVTKKSTTYSFKGEESWQPLTELAGMKCKRCGFYEEDTLKADDIYDEWEVCPSDFPPDGRYVRFKEKEFNATFFCPQCRGSGHPSEGAEAEEKKSNVGTIAVVIIASMLVSLLCIFGTVAGYKYWRKRRREQEQARFLKLFEDGDDIEDEFGVDQI